jgi:hypothetical protein
MTTVTFTIYCQWDDEAKVWFVVESDVPGLAAEAPTFDAMNQLLRNRVPELVELNRPDLTQLAERERAPVELVIHNEHRLRLASA